MTPIYKSYNTMYVSMVAKSISKKLSAPPDLNNLRQDKPDNISDTLALLQVGVNWGMMEYQYGEYLSQLVDAFADITAADVASVANRYLTEENRMTLVLTPRASE